jgi:hypothetical protein
MITAEMLQHLITMDCRQLERLAAVSDYKGDRFASAEFVGITNGGEFCYACTFVDQDGSLAKTKLFLSYDHGTQTTTLDY